MKRILVTGACGQIGSEMVMKLREVYGEKRVIATDIRERCDTNEDVLYEILDVTDGGKFYQIAEKYQVDTVMHLAGVLSAKAEKQPKIAWDLNMSGLMNCLEVARELDLKVFTPSSIGAFGPETPKVNTPQDTLQRPKTIYGVGKMAGELLCDYYFHRYQVDARGLRYPGLISYEVLPGGGTTDYAVGIYYGAVKKRAYTSYLKEGTYMDMMYMPDAIEAAITLMEADPNKLIHRNAFNVTAFSAAPEDFAKAIRQHIPEFKLDYCIDPVRQGIADSWPDHIDARAAAEEWGFSYKYDLAAMTKEMLEKIREKLKAE